ncbi:MAG: hypothetical protein K8I27_15415 [Planctomycetes bacterium]|nr:hypothetical protein [Planctomycetota bacterium]
MHRWIVLTIAALCAVFFVKPVSSNRTESEEPDEYWKTYSLEGIPFQGQEDDGSMLPRPVPVFGRTGAFSSEESPVIIYPVDWHPGAGSRSLGWFETARD